MSESSTGQSEPQTIPAGSRQGAIQPDLPGLAEAFKAIGLENVPVGVADLSKREQRFCLEFLRTGNNTEAARLAGYNSPSKNGGKVRQRRGVAAFLAQAGSAVAKEATQLVIRVSERSRSLHALLRAELEQESGGRLDRIYKLTTAVTRTDLLLAALNGVGRVSGVHVSGDIAHTHAHQGEVSLTVPETAVPVLAQMKRSGLTPTMTGAELAQADRN